MNALELTLIRIGFLAVLWLFVIAAVGVVRTDLFGPASQRRRRSAAGRATSAAAEAQGQARPDRPLLAAATAGDRGRAGRHEPGPH